MKKLLSLAAGLVGVVVLAAAGRGGCLPEQDAGYVKVHFKRTPGVNDFSSHPTVDLDGKNLSVEEAKQLRKLIEDAGFFDLKSTPPQSPVVPDPMSGYDLTVDMDGRTHTVWVADENVGKSLKPLIDLLTARMQMIEIRNQLMVPLRTREEEQPAVRVEFTQSGGIAGHIFPTTTIDGATLSAEDARKLVKLIAEVRFFDRPEQYPIHGADLYEYTITVELNGKRHSVSYDDEPAELKPLIDWLSSRPVPEASVGHVTPL